MFFLFFAVEEVQKEQIIGEAVELEVEEFM